MVKIYLDGADLETMRELEPRVAGFTTNPSLMAKAGIKRYREFAAAIVALTDKPVSFEVTADFISEMDKQARDIATWGHNVYVKIPAVNSKGESTLNLVRQLSLDGIKLNVTAVFTIDQINTFSRVLLHAPAILSIFAGRIADTGRDPIPFIARATQVKAPRTEILWASTREVLNVRQAESAGADVITMTPDLIKKMGLFGKDLTEYSRETAQQFFNDAREIVW